MDGLAISWLIRAALFTVAAGIWISYLLEKPRHWMAPFGLIPAIYVPIVLIWQVIERADEGPGPFSLPLTWAVGIAWGMMGMLLIVSGLHAIRIRKLRNGTYHQLASVVRDYEKKDRVA